MRLRIRRLLEILAIVTGISGITLSNFKDSFSIAFYSTLTLLIIVSIIAFLSWREDNVFKSKLEIDSIWGHLLLGATRSIKLFAGDVSWIDRDKDVLKQRIQEGVVVSVLCRQPHNEKTTNNVFNLLDAGAEVKYYNPEHIPVVRGLLIDDEELSRRTALTISKSAKPKVTIAKNILIKSSANRGSGVPGDSRIYQYEANRYLSSKDTHQITMLSDLFSEIWRDSIKGSINGVVLKPLDINKDNITQLLQKVPHYNLIRPNDLRFQVVDIQSLWSACTYVKYDDFVNIRPIIEAYYTQRIQNFTPCYCISHLRKSILLPPILEEHDGKYIIIDGMHRLFYKFAFKNDSDALCLIISTNINLPSSPVPFTEVQMWPQKLPRRQVFRDYKPELFRNINLLDKALEDNFSKLYSK